MNFFKYIFKEFLAIFDKKIVNISFYKDAIKKSYKSLHLDLIIKLTENNKKIINYYSLSKSELLQDLFVLSELNLKKRGYFVEIGAGDGDKFSNTWLLEKKFKFKGILVEPCKKFYKKIKQRNCHKNYSAIYSISNKYLDFSEMKDNPFLSGLKIYAKENKHEKRILKTYKINTITLIDLLKKYKAPKIIDYLSLDIEGAEFDSLKNFDFKEYIFRIITIEHNGNIKNRRKIYNLLKKNGYKRKYKEYSCYDDWYIKAI